MKWLNQTLKGALLLLLQPSLWGLAFTTPQTLDSLPGVRTLTTADLNQDGTPDLLVGRWGTHQGLWLYPGPGFQEGTLLDPSLAYPQHLQVADLNLDDRPDLMLFTSLQPGSLLLYPGPWPTPPLLLDTLSFPTGLVLADLDQNQRLDYVALGDVHLSVGLQQPDGSWHRQALPVLSEYYTLSVTDLNDDGLPDLAVGSVSFFVFLNQGNGQFLYDSLRSASLHPSGLVFRLQASDLNLDGHTDLVAYASGTPSLQWFPNLGEGFFGPPQTIEMHVPGIPEVQVADLDQDGDPDLVATHPQEGQVVWYENLQAGQFSGAQVLGEAPGSVVATLLVADLNRDGLPDLAWAPPLSVQFQVATRVRESHPAPYPEPALRWVGRRTLLGRVSRRASVRIVTPAGREVWSRTVGPGPFRYRISLVPGLYLALLQEDGAQPVLRKLLVLP